MQCGQAWLRAESSQNQLMSEERLRVAFRRPAFHTPQPRQAEEGLSVEPLLGALAPEMGDQKIDFLLQNSGRNRHVQIGLAYIPIPFWNFILKNAVIPERIPSKPADMPMILMRVSPSMGKNEVGIDTFSKRREP